MEGKISRCLASLHDKEDGVGTVLGKLKRYELYITKQIIWVIFLAGSVDITSATLTYLALKLPISVR